MSFSIYALMALLSAEASSQIDEVVVFADRAEVTRTMKVPCTDRRAVAVFEPLPPTLDARTLRSPSKGQGTILGLTTALLTETDAIDERTRTLEAERRAITDQIARIDETLRGLEAEGKRIDAYRTLLGGVLAEEIRGPRPSTSRWARALDGLAAQHESLDGRRLTAERKRLELDRKQQVLRRKIARIGSGRTKASRTAQVTIDCEDRAQVRAALSYLVPGATWRPEYDFDFAPDRGTTGPGRARLTIGAAVRQNTGEDWTKVRLRLSTARPTLGTEAPQPRALFVSAFERKTDKVLVEGYERRQSLPKNEKSDTPQSSEPADNQGEPFVLLLPHRVSIVSDGRPSWSPVDVVTSKGAARLVAIPKEDDRIYHAVKLDNPAKFPLLPGPIRSYRRGSFVGSSRLRYRGLVEPMEVSLGVDESIRARRSTLNKTDKSAGFLSSTKHLARGYEIELHSRQSSPTVVEVQENIPVSKIEDVEVELIAAGMTAGYALDAERGLLTWSVPLAPGERKKIRLAYEIHLPEDWQVPK